jgi:hypothetical protein
MVYKPGWYPQQPGMLLTVPEPEPSDVTRLLGMVAQILASTVAIVAIVAR